jgi:hypothetical protein
VAQIFLGDLGKSLASLAVIFLAAKFAEKRPERRKENKLQTRKLDRAS